MPRVEIRHLFLDREPRPGDEDAGLPDRPVRRVAEQTADEARRPAMEREGVTVIHRCSIDGKERNVLDDLLIDGLEIDERRPGVGNRARRRPEHCCLAHARRPLRELRLCRRAARQRPCATSTETSRICLSLNFPGRYRSGRMDVRRAGRRAQRGRRLGSRTRPRNPCDRSVEARYWLLYVARERWATLAAERRGAACRDSGVDGRRRRGGVRDRVHRRSRDGADELEQEERLAALLARLLPGAHPRHARPASASTLTGDMLDRARDYVQAHALDRISLAEVARECGASPQHLSARFRARFGVPVHRFQTLLRLDHARAGFSRAARRQARRRPPAACPIRAT